MLWTATTTVCLVALAHGYPWVLDSKPQLQSARQLKRDSPPTVRDPVFISGRHNTGAAHPIAIFDAEAQLVDVRAGSANEFRAPGANDCRGQCPGLNAAANHGFLPRNGLPTIAQTITGLGAAYNMAPDLSLVLATLGVAQAGDYVTQRWSIGGSFPSTLPTLLGQPTGILGTHNRYESDASPIRGDAYLNGGNVNVFQIRQWEYLYNLNTEYTLDDIARLNEYNQQWSIANNPYWFSGVPAGIVPPAAHVFIINFMSNHSAAVPGGTLTREVLQSFFSVTGSPGSFVHTPRHERIPENWYERPAADAYSLVSTGLDIATNNAMYPGILGVGGNTGSVNTCTGVNLRDLTGGVFDGATLADGNNLACFILQASQAALLDQLEPIYSSVGAVIDFVQEQLGPLSEQLECPQLSVFNNTLFDPFPGSKGQG